MFFMILISSATNRICVLIPFACTHVYPSRYMTYDFEKLTKIGTLFLVVEGVEEQEGDFELHVTCEPARPHHLRSPRQCPAIYANFDDGTYEDVTSDAALSSLRPASVSVVVDGDDGSKGLLVEVGALKVCYPVLEASLSVCGVAIDKGTGVVMLDMPDAVSVSVSPSSTKIAKSGDGATAIPFSVTTEVSLSVTVSFDDGSEKSFSSDSRTDYRVVDDGSETMVELQNGNSLVVLPSALITAESAVVSVFVSFPGVFALNATASVTVVELASMALGTQPYPTVGGFSGDVEVLKLVSCSGVYQRLEVTASAALSDGTQQTALNFYKRVVYTSSNTTIAAFASAPSWSGLMRGLLPLQVGSTTITGSFGGLNASMVKGPRLVALRELQHRHV